mmetsp:Transcript_21947/g.47922  ORF Transcript_21947/g.47922 Transcript_21947/m.47922 type:complete len:268 (+) Transcript_21947:153-956(+)
MQLAWSCERRLEHSAPIGLASGDVVAGDDHLAARVLHGHLGAGVAMRLEQLGDVKLGLLEHLDLAQVDVLHRVDAVARLLDLLANNLGDEFVDEIPEIDGGGVSGHDVAHLLPDELLLGRVGVARLLELVLPLLGKADAEKAEDVAVGGLHVDMALDERLPLAHERAQLIGGELEAVELGEAVGALHLLALQLDLAVGLVLVLVQVGEANLEHAALEHLRGDLCAGRPCDGRLAAAANCEVGRRLDVIPLLLGEGIDDLLSLSLLAL